VLQFVFPGMWLSDLTRGRYEVREKKCVKKVYRLIPSTFHFDMFNSPVLSGIEKEIRT
jgi:hypothetical protein